MLVVVLKSLKKVLLSRVELWIVAILLSLATLGFGAFMKNGAERSTPRGGVPGRVAFRVGSMPANLYRWFFRAPEPPPQVLGMAREQRFHGRDGLTFAPPPPSDAARAERPSREAGYLVVARHVPFPETNVAELPEATSTVITLPVAVEIIDFSQRKVVHSWEPVSGYRPDRFNVLPDGSLLAVSGNGDRATRMFRMDACSNVVWEQRLRAHHSFERGVDGNFWSPWTVSPNTIFHTNPDRAHNSFERGVDGNFWSPWTVSPNTISHANPDIVKEGFVRFSPAGEVLSWISLSGALMRAGHRHFLYGMAESRRQPLHMNDVEPVLQDGPFWRRGDLFVSLRNASVVLLYRPATDEVLWLQAGPWLHQHDVDVVSDSEISVYSNNAFYDGKGYAVLGANEVYVHNFATDETRSPWREAMRRHDVRTERRGGATVFDDGSVMLEEAQYGRILMLAPNGEQVWSYVNRGSDGRVYEIREGRYLDAEYGAGLVRSIASLDCGAEMD